MDAEILAVGSELLTPQRMDTNSLWLTAQLNDLGVEVRQKTIVGDNRSRLADAVREALKRASIVILTGGLGPTEDDVTREAVAAALDRKLVFHEDLLAGIEALFRARGRKMAEINRRQAYLIEGAVALPNNRGTAPGQWIDAGQTVVILLPGPPRELQPMFAEHCIPRLRERLPGRVIRTRVYRVAGMPESDLDQLLSPVYTKYSNPETTILAALGDIQIHLRAQCDTAAEAEQLLEELGSQIEPLLGDRIYSRDGCPLEAVVGRLLRDRGESLVVAESCTGGMISARVTEVPGSSHYFLGGFVVYSTAMKTQLLNVPPELIASHSPVSREVAEAMAAGARASTGATYALAVTGEAGPEPAVPGVPVGTVWVGLATPGGIFSRCLTAGNDRERVRAMAVQMALAFLHEHLRKGAASTP